MLIDKTRKTKINNSKEKHTTTTLFLSLSHLYTIQSSFLLVAWGAPVYHAV